MPVEQDSSVVEDFEEELVVLTVQPWVTEAVAAEEKALSPTPHSDIVSSLFEQGHLTSPERFPERLHKGTR